MLLEHLAKKAAQPPKNNWKLYYRWLFSSLSGRDVTDYKFWKCQNCRAVNLQLNPARYRECRHCKLTYLTKGNGWNQ